MAPIYGRTPASNFPVRIYGSLLQEKLSEKKALNFVELMFCQEKARRNNATTRARANSSTATAGTVTTTAASAVSRTTGTCIVRPRPHSNLDILETAYFFGSRISQPVNRPTQTAPF